MKHKNIFLTLALSSLALGSFISCSESFLDETPQSSYSPEQLGDEKGTEASLKGLHYLFGQLWSWSDRQGWLSCWQVGTDVASPGGVEGVEIPFYQYGELTSENDAVAYMWKQCYKVINNANAIIATLGEDGNAAQLAEAKFFRGYMYNMLATLYGGVPLCTEPTQVAKDDFVRASVNEINDLVVSDLKFASENLPDMSGLAQQSRANKYMAKQALGEVYLRLNMNAEAETVLSEIINSGELQLVKQRYGTYAAKPGDCFHDMFIYGNQRRNQGNTEAIWTFELEYNKVTGSDGFTNAPQHRRVFNPSYHNIPGMSYEADSLGGRGNGRCRPSSWVVNGLYEEGDMRNSEYNIKRHLYYNAEGFEATYAVDKNGWRVDSDSPDKVGEVSVKTGDPVVLQVGDTIMNFYPYSTKWNSYDPADGWGWTCIKDYPMMRLGETYLLRAEARFKQGNSQGAADDINVLRERAYPEYPSKGKVDAGKVDMNFILDERVRELLFEENRRMTLVRTGTLVERAALNTEKTIKGEITGLESKHLLLPIPLTEIQRNTGAVLEQNPGY